LYISQAWKAMMSLRSYLASLNEQKENSDVIHYLSQKKTNVRGHSLHETNGGDRMTIWEQASHVRMGTRTILHQFLARSLVSGQESQPVNVRPFTLGWRVVIAGASTVPLFDGCKLNKRDNLLTRARPHDGPVVALGGIEVVVTRCRAPRKDLDNNKEKKNC